MQINTDKTYIRAEELCYRLNAEFNSDIFTVTKLQKMCRNGTIKCHDLRTPGTKLPRYFFKYDEVIKCLEKNMKK